MHLSFTGEEESAKARTVMNSTMMFPVADRPRKDDRGGESQKEAGRIVLAWRALTDSMSSERHI